ncbi:MAG: hypothetical protein ACE366_28540 [Bradymonadia bacterium]
MARPTLNDARASMVAVISLWSVKFWGLWLMAAVITTPTLWGSALAFAAAAGAIVSVGTVLSVTGAWRQPLVLSVVCGLIAVTLINSVDGTVIDGRPSAALAWVAGLGLLSLAHSLGVAIGGKVLDPAWIWPLALVGAGADVMSLMSPEGPTHQIVEAGPSLTWIATLIHMPTPGLGVTPIIGVGDIAFTGVMLRAVAVNGLSWRRGISGALAGFTICFVVLVVTEKPIPALPFIGPAMALALWQKPRPRELAMALVMCALMVGVGLWRMAG